MPTEPAAIHREHIESFVLDQLRRWKPYTALNRYRPLTVFFTWLVAEGELPESPMARMNPPAVPDDPVAVLTEDDLRRLLRTCEGVGFEERRDLAILRLFMDTGMRRAELDFANNVALVLGKGRRPRACPFGRRTTQALDRYIRQRSRHPHAEREQIWVGRGGPMSDCGIYQTVRRRGGQAGFPSLKPHQFRHTFAHLWLARGDGRAACSLATTPSPAASSGRFRLHRGEIRPPGSPQRRGCAGRCRQSRTACHAASQTSRGQCGRPQTTRP